MSILQIIIYLNECKYKINEEQKKNKSAERDCELTDEWIQVEEMTEYLTELNKTIQ